jgi:hypothetical protein
MSQPFLSTFLDLIDTQRDAHSGLWRTTAVAQVESLRAKIFLELELSPMSEFFL